MITIKEMANMLGISSTTVSNVIHGKTKEVSQATIDKVNKLVEEYGYVPNICASNLASNKSRLIGVGVVSKENDNNYLRDAFVSELIGVIEHELKKYGYFVMLYFSETAQELIRTIKSWNVEGMIFFGMRQEDCELLQKQYKKPQVYIDSYFGDTKIKGVDIGLDDRQGGHLMANYLIEQGHKEILFVSDNFAGADYERYCGFSAAMREAGYHVSQRNYMRLGAGEEDLQKSLAELYRVYKQYSVIFAASDYYALHIINYFYDHDVRVPEDISIVGFDDNIYSKMCRPAITTIHQSPKRKSELAVDYMMRLLNGEEIENNWIRLPVELVIRDSVKRV